MASAVVQSLFRVPSGDSSLSAASAFSERRFHQYHELSTHQHRGHVPLPPPSLYDKETTRPNSTTSSLLFHQPQYHNRSASLSVGRTEEYLRQQNSRPALPGLSALASLASMTPSRSFSSSPALGITHSMQPIPTPGISGNNTAPPVCQNCQTSTTPLWRRDESGSVLCNACGLFLKLHGRPRPISLKTDVIKSRNRVKSSTQGLKKKYESLPASQSVDITNGAHRRVSQMATSVASDRSGSPISRTISPSGQQDPNIAPQHIFDGVTLTDHAFQSPSLPSLHLNQPSPGSASSDRHLEPPMTYDQLFTANTHLKTRVSELEVINMMYSDNENNLRTERDGAIRTQEELKRRIQDLEERLRHHEDQEHPQKKQRLSEETA